MPSGTAHGGRDRRTCVVTFNLKDFPPDGTEQGVGRAWLDPVWISAIDDHVVRLPGGLTRIFGRVDMLMLEQSGVKDDDLKHISAFRYLKQIELGGAEITDVGLEHIAEVDSLEVVSLRGTAVSRDGLLRLRRKRPTLDIVSDFDGRVGDE